MKKIMEVNGEVYVRVSFLVDYGMNRASVHNALKKFRDKKSERYEYFIDPVDKRIRWIKYLSIPLSARLRKNLPLVEDLIANYKKINNSKITELIRTSFDLMITTGYKQFTNCYWGIISDQDTVIEYAKIHGLFYVAADLSRYEVSIKEIHHIFQEYEKYTNKNYSKKYFYKKLSDFKERGSFALLHDSLLKKKEKLKLTDAHLEKIGSLYKSTKLLSGTEITDELNKWAIKKGMLTVSLSSVKKIIADRYFQNRYRPIRNGIEWETKFNKEFRLRITPKNNHELWEIDGSRYNVAYYNKVKKSPDFLQLFVVMEVYSRKIIGYSVGPKENHQMVIDAMRMAVQSTGHLPKQILRDNGSCFKHKKSKEMFQHFIFLGAEDRPHAVGNARDKSHVERFFGILQNKVLKFYDGYIGEGVKSKRVDARPALKVLTEALKVKNLRTKEEMFKLVDLTIEQYNDLRSKKDDLSPKLRYEIGKLDKDAIPVSQSNDRFLFWNKRLKRVKNSSILITEGSFRNKEYQYILPEELRDKYNGTDVVTCFNKEDRSSISIFDQNEKWIADIKLSPPVPIVRPKVERKISRNVKKDNFRKKQYKGFKQPASFDELFIKNKGND